MIILPVYITKQVPQTRYNIFTVPLHYPRLLQHLKTKNYFKSSYVFSPLDTLHLYQTNFHALKYVTPYIFFIRIQKQYNKRRYTRVKTNSRASFWAGLTLSTICAYMCWPATIQFTDWGLVTPLICDMYIPITIMYIILLHKITRNVNRPQLNTTSNKSVITNNICNILYVHRYFTWKWF